MLGAFAVGLVVLVLVAVLLVAVNKPAKARPACTVGTGCPPPPGPPRLAAGKPWRSTLGFEVDYGPGEWKLSSQNGTSAAFCFLCTASGQAGAMRIVGRRGTDYQGLFDDEIAKLKSSFNLVESTDPARALLTPAIGHVHGVGKDYCGDAQSTQGGSIPVDVVALASKRANLSVFVAFLSVGCTKTNNSKKSPVGDPALGRADVLLGTFRWPGEAQ